MVKGGTRKITLNQDVISEVMRTMGRKGGKAKVPKGVAKLKPAERSRRAKAAAKARWGKKGKEK
jgi:ribosomal protein L19E